MHVAKNRKENMASEIDLLGSIDLNNCMFPLFTFATLQKMRCCSKSMLDRVASFLSPHGSGFKKQIYYIRRLGEAMPTRQTRPTRPRLVTTEPLMLRIELPNGYDYGESIVAAAIKEQVQEQVQESVAASVDRLELVLIEAHVGHYMEAYADIYDLGLDFSSLWTSLHEGVQFANLSELHIDTGSRHIANHYFLVALPPLLTSLTPVMSMSNLYILCDCSDAEMHRLEAIMHKCFRR
jgi:hypothetical protein